MAVLYYDINKYYSLSCSYLHSSKQLALYCFISQYLDSVESRRKGHFLVPHPYSYVGLYCVLGV